MRASIPYDVEDGRVPLAELGSYATMGRMNDWGVRADADGMVEVCSPFTSVSFTRVEAGDVDARQASFACQALQRRDRDIYDDARATFHGDTRTHEDRLKHALARRAGAALWLFRRDLRRPGHSCTGLAEGWSFHPACQVYNSDGHLSSLRVGTRTGQEVDITLRLHALEGGVFRMAAWVDVQVFHSGGTRTNGSYASDKTELDRALHAEMVALACRLAEESYVEEVTRAQARLNHLRGRLALV